MRGALWLLALFGIAVAAALVAGNNQAVVTLFWPPHRIDISFNLLVLLLGGLFTLLYVALRAGVPSKKSGRCTPPSWMPWRI
jgi:HemY protein